MIRLADGILSATLEQLRRCGRGQAECVVYWTASLAEPDHVARVVHPRHNAGAWSYEVDAPWLDEFMVELHRARETVRAQVHTHAAAAFHSETDDRWPLVQTPGFLSLVLPDFAEGELDPRRLFLAELSTCGDWSEVPAATRIKGLG